MNCDVWLTVDELRCSYCGQKLSFTYEGKTCPNPDCGVEFETGKRPMVVIP